MHIRKIRKFLYKTKYKKYNFQDTNIQHYMGKLLIFKSVTNMSLFKSFQSLNNICDGFFFRNDTDMGNVNKIFKSTKTKQSQSYIQVLF